MSVQVKQQTHTRPQVGEVKVRVAVVIEKVRGCGKERELGALVRGRAQARGTHKNTIAKASLMAQESTNNDRHQSG